MKHPLSPLHNGGNRLENDDTVHLWSSSVPLPRALSARARGSCSSVGKPPTRELGVVNSVFRQPPCFTKYYFGFLEGEHSWLDNLFFTNTGVLISSNFPLILRCGDWWGNCPVSENSALGLSTSSAGRHWLQLWLGTVSCQCGIPFAFCPGQHRKSQFTYAPETMVYSSPTLNILLIAFQ